MNTYKRIAIVIIAASVALSLAVGGRVVMSQMMPLTNGINYLKATQNGDGSWAGTATSLNGVLPTTATTLEALRAVESSTSTNQTSAIQFLSAQTVDVNPFLAARINALVGTSANTTADRDSLIASQNTDGGWGTADVFTSDPLDTSMVLSALNSANVSDISIKQRGLSYLLRTQNADGGWALTQGEESQIFYSAHALQALGSLRLQFDTTGSRDRAIAFLRGKQNPNGGYGQPSSTAFETGLALLSIYSAGRPLTPAETNAINYLNNTQQANGSWVDDAYSTALAIRALAFPKDSDGDGMPDDWESTYGLNPNDPVDALLDKDGDGLINVQEYLNHCSKPNNPDTDGDGITDGDEIKNGSNPCDPASQNRAPVINSQPKTTASQLESYSYQVQATDADNDPLTYSLLKSPTGMIISNSGIVQWTPASNQIGSFTVIIMVSDGRASEIQQYKLSVLAQGIDLTVASVEPASATDLQTMIVSGAVRVNIQNEGATVFASSFDVLLFEDRNTNGTYQAGTDVAFGSGSFTGSIDSNAIAILDVPVSGVAQFRDNLIYAFVDSSNQIPELDETNNYGQSGLSSKYQPPVGDYLPKVKWQYNDNSSGAEGLLSTPIVAPLIDTDGDGLINERDVPAVIFVPKNIPNDRPTVLRGDTGAVIFKGTGSGERVLDFVFSTPAVGDIDGDGKPEILVNAFYQQTPRVYCFNNDGTLKWSSPTITGGTQASLVIADLDGDGKSEIIGQAFCLNFDGTLRWNRSNQVPPYRGGFYNNASAIVADLDLDGKQEVILGPKALDKDGQVIWSWSSGGIPGDYTLTGKLDRGANTVLVQSDSILRDSYTAITNMDDDPYPEIIAVTDDNNGGGAGPIQAAWVLEHDGRIKAGPIHLFQGAFNQLAFRLGPPTVADFDGDGQPEVAIPVLRRQVGTPTPTNHRQYLLNVYKFRNNTLELLWQKDFVAGGGDDSPPPVTAFDFDGDGAQEPVYLDSQRLYILDGKNGSTRFEMGVERTNEQSDQRYPAIADVDNDGVAEIIVPTLLAYRANAAARKGVLVLGDTKGNWRSARRAWNEWVYRITNVNENGLIPATPKRSWQEFNSFRAQTVAEGVAHFAAPDLSVSKVTINAQNCPASAGITARIGNGGSLHGGAGLAVNFYLGDPSFGGLLIGTKKTSKLIMPGEFEDVTLAWNAPVAGNIFVTVNDPPTSNLVGSSNLSGLPNAWVQTSGFDTGNVSFNFGAVLGIDGLTNTLWSDQGTLSTGSSFYEVRFPFPVNASSVTVQNAGSSTTGFLTGTLSFSNSFTQPMILNSSGAGTLVFPEQQHVTWVRLTASSTKANGASVSEFLVAGSYVEPQFQLNEGAGRSGNNKASSPSNLAPCDTSGNRPPVITSAPLITATSGVAYAYQVTATDPNNDPLGFSMTSGPSGLTMNGTGLITWTPNDSQAGDQNVGLQVSDGRGGTAQQQFSIRVALTSGNHAPQITSTPPATVGFGQSYQYDVTATDADGDTILFSITNAPAGVSLDQFTGHLGWTPNPAQTGTQFFTLQANDGRGGKTAQSFTVSLQPAPAPTPTPDKDSDGSDETEDCDDNDSSVNPAMVEIPGNGKDDDCNPATPDTLPAGAVACSIVSNKRNYDANSVAQLTLTARNITSDLSITGLEARVTVNDAGGQAAHSNTLAVNALSPNGLFRATEAFNTGTRTPGVYQAVLEVRFGSASVCSAQSTFAIVSSAARGNALRGSITANPTEILQGNSTFAYEVSNVGNSDLSALNLSIQVVKLDSGAVVRTFADQTSLNRGQSFSNQKTFSSANVPGGEYLAVLQGESGGVTQTVDSAAFQIVNQPPVALCRDVTRFATRNVAPEEVGQGSSDPDGGPITLTLTPANPYPLGTTPVTLTVTDDKGSSSQCTANITINRGLPTVSWHTPSPIVYGTPLSNLQLNATASFNSVALPGTFTYSQSAGTVLNAGNGQTLKVSFTPADADNYTEAEATVTINVTKATLTVGTDNKSKTYGDANPPFTGSITGLRNGDNITATFDATANANSGVGNYPITAVLADPTNTLANYSVTNDGGILSITRKELAITADSKSRIYKTANPPLTFSVVGFVNGDTAATALTGSPSLSTVALTESNVGTYSIILGPGTLNSANYNFAFLPGTLTINQAGTRIVTDTRTLANNLAGTLIATLLDADSGPVSNQTVTLTLGAEAGAQMCSAITDAMGKASCQINPVQQPLGAAVVSGNFAGDINYGASVGSGPTLIYAFAAGSATFVIGDGNAMVGSQVTFWGAQWTDLNTLSGSAAPSSFKGFANRSSATPPDCGGTWTTDSGNSSNPPNSIPAYMAVFVSSSITSSGSTINGNIRQIVIVKTNPGYDGNPGHAGTGQVVAVSCY